MVNVVKGVLVECDPAMKQFLLHLDETNALGRKFILQDLDETHLFIASDIIKVLQDRIDNLMDQLYFSVNTEKPSRDGDSGRWVWRHTKRLMAPDDPLFDEGDEACGLLVRQMPVVDADDDGSDGLLRVETFPCPFAQCKQEFDRVHVFEAHYNSWHRHSCSQCRRTFPSPHLLDIHILESHDALFQILAERQPMFQCLVMGCAEKFQTSLSRKNHLVRVHKYPANFRFHRLPKGSKSARKMGGGEEDSMEVDATVEKPPQPSDNPPASPQMPPQLQQPAQRVFSYRVPDHITFGHQGEKGFQRSRGQRGGRGRGRGRHWHQSAAMEVDTTVDIQTVTLTDLADALDDPNAGGDR